MVLIELDKQNIYEGLREFSALPTLSEWEFCRKRVMRPSELDPPKLIGEKMIEGYRLTLERMPDPEQSARTQALISAGLQVHTEKGIRRQVGLMLGAFPNARPHDPEIYVTSLIYDALDLRLPDAVVAQTCQLIRRTQKFVPAVSEFLETANGVWARWRHALRILEHIEARRRERVKAIETIRNVMLSASEEPEQGDDDVPF